MALIVEHGILIGIIPPLIAIGISAVTYYMCIKQLSSVITMTLFISENTATLPLGKTYAFLRVEGRGKKNSIKECLCAREIL